MVAELLESVLSGFPLSAAADVPGFAGMKNVTNSVVHQTLTVLKTLKHTGTAGTFLKGP